jgi:hypothetical protein
LCCARETAEARGGVESEQGLQRGKSTHRIAKVEGDIRNIDTSSKNLRFSPEYCLAIIAPVALPTPHTVSSDMRNICKTALIGIDRIDVYDPEPERFAICRNSSCHRH